MANKQEENTLTGIEYGEMLDSINKEFNTVLNFPNGFNDNGEYILITAGGGGGIV